MPADGAQRHAEDCTAAVRHRCHWACRRVTAAVAIGSREAPAVDNQQIVVVVLLLIILLLRSVAVLVYVVVSVICCCR